MSVEFATFQEIVAASDLERDIVLPVAAENRRMRSAIEFCLDYDGTYDDSKEHKAGYEEYVAEVAARYGVTEKDIPELLNIYENNLRV